MTRLFVSLAALILYLAPPVAQAFATSHVRPPGTAFVQPTSADTEGTSGTDTDALLGTFGTFLSDNHEAFRTYGLIFGGVAGLIFAFWRARIATRQADAAAARADAAIDQARAANEQARAANEQARAANEQARIAEQGQFTERFSRAAEHLGSGQLPVRLGGIYALWRLTRDSPERDVVSVIDILCAFVRDPPLAEPPQTGPSTETADAAQPGQEPSDAAAKLRPDVQTVLKLIGDKTAEYRAILPAGYRLDLTGADLARADLTGADLTRANLTNADLTNADLTNADLADADLTNAILRRALLRRATLTKANFWSANLTGAILAHANLTSAYLYYANLTRANLNGADLTDADLWQANLTSADLVRANLTRTQIADSDLTGAKLRRADLTGADLTGAENLTQGQLDIIRYDPDDPPKLPPGLVLPEPRPEPPAE